MTKDGSHSEYGNVITDTLCLVIDFCFCMFTHVKRLVNSVAHFLVRRAKSSSEFRVWIESILDDITPLVAQEICNFFFLVFPWNKTWPTGLDSQEKKKPIYS